MLFNSIDNLYSQNQQRMMSQSQHRNCGGSFTSQSVLTAVQRFVNTVNTMNETVMVPSRLLDMDLTGEQTRPLPELLHDDPDPYAVYAMLNSTKNSLMYGLPKSDEEEHNHRSTRHDSCSDRWSRPYDFTNSEHKSTISNREYNSSTFTNNNITSSSSTNNISKHPPNSRKSSTLSMNSVGSASSETSTESDIAEESTNRRSEEGDSASGPEENTPSSVIEATSHLKEHLIGLYSCLTQLSDTAAYITDRYQEDISK